MQNKEIDLPAGHFDAMREWAEQAPDTRAVICLVSEAKGEEVLTHALIGGGNRLVVKTMHAAMQKSQEFATAVVAAKMLHEIEQCKEDEAEDNQE